MLATYKSIQTYIQIIIKIRAGRETYGNKNMVNTFGTVNNITHILPKRLTFFNLIMTTKQKNSTNLHTCVHAYYM